MVKSCQDCANLLCRNIISRASPENDREHLDCGTNGTSVIEIQAKFLCDPKNILEKLSLEEEMLYDVAVLSGFFVVLRLIGLFILWCKVKSEH